MSIGTRLFTWMRGAPVGTDGFGNRYFKEKRTKPGRRERRWVLYNGEAEASRVPPEWHAWLHHTVDAPPSGPVLTRPWMKPHQPNLTGTPEAYLPPGHELRGGARRPAPAGYEPWQPE